MTSRLVLIVLLLTCGGYFFGVVARRLRLLRTAPGAAHGSWPADRIGHRLWRVFKEVMLQTRVISARPAAGILHALVMWGFFVFAWVSAEHLWLGPRALAHAGANESWYGWFAAFWALAVLTGIAGLSFRRFVLRPKTLGEVSVSSGVVAALIAGLMVSYLLGWRFLPVGQTAWRVNWWAHTLCLLGMLIAIPRSKHLHLLLGPLAIFFRSDTTSSLRALREDDDDDFGMRTVGDLSPKDLLDVNACVECGRCTDACPANVVGGLLDPKNIILRMQGALLDEGGTLAGTPGEVAAGTHWIREGDLFECLSCGACEQACPVGIEHVGAKILDMRRGLVSEGRTHSDKLTQLFTTMERAPHNPWGVAREARRKFIEAASFPLFDGTQEWLFWLGCGNSYDPQGQQVARAMKKILDAAGVSWGVLERETCCGEPARRAGNEYLYMELAAKVTGSFRANKVKKLLTCCPHCARMLDDDYRQDAGYNALGIEVVHHTEFLAHTLPLLPESANLDTTPGAVTFHDPCYLARGRGVTRQPRAVLEAAGFAIREMSHNRQETFCCGAGGAQLFIADDQAESAAGRVNHKRFAEASATGARTIAVACPYCPIMLKDAAQHAGREDIRIADVAELVADRIG